MDAIDLGLGAILLVSDEKFFWLFVRDFGFYRRFESGQSGCWSGGRSGRSAGGIGWRFYRRGGSDLFCSAWPYCPGGLSLAGGYILEPRADLAGHRFREPVLDIICRGWIIGAFLVTLLFDWALDRPVFHHRGESDDRSAAPGTAHRIWLFLLLALVESSSRPAECSATGRPPALSPIF